MFEDSSLLCYLLPRHDWRSSMLEAGDKAPDFTLDDQDGTPVSLSDFRGRKVLVWFFPKASTPQQYGWLIQHAPVGHRGRARRLAGPGEQVP